MHQSQTCFGASFPDGIANSAPEQAHEIASVRKHGGRPSKREVRLVGSRDFGLGGLARKRIVGALVELPYAVAIETLLLDLEVRA